MKLTILSLFILSFSFPSFATLGPTSSISDGTCAHIKEGDHQETKKWEKLLAGLSPKKEKRKERKKRPGDNTGQR